MSIYLTRTDVVCTYIGKLILFVVGKVGLIALSVITLPIVLVLETPIEYIITGQTKTLDNFCNFIDKTHYKLDRLFR